MTAYYNEIEPFAAQWLRNLIAAGHIAPGDVDERSIADVQPDDLVGYTQCHFFAGLGGWNYGLRLAGWSDDQAVWTGSCPCQPFSAAGKGGGFDDERHLWPHQYRLIAARRPPVWFGEQVASPAGLGWFDTVQSDLERAGYAVAANDICAAGVGAPHIRQRLWIVADAELPEGARQRQYGGEILSVQESVGLTGIRGSCVVADAGHDGFQGRADQDVCGTGRGFEGGTTRRSGGAPVVGMADADGGDASAERLQRSGEHGLGSQDARVGDVRGMGFANGAGSLARDETAAALGQRNSADATSGRDRPRPYHSPWANPDWLYCRDGKWRPVEPGTFPLAHGVSARVGRLRAYGNAIVPQVAAEFIGAYLDSL